MELFNVHNFQRFDPRFAEFQPLETFDGFCSEWREWPLSIAKQDDEDDAIAVC